MATEAELKFLQRLAKKGKGSADMLLATSALALIGFDLQPTIMTIDMAKLNNGNWIVESMLKEWKTRNRVRAISDPRYMDDKRWTFYLNDGADDQQAIRELLDLVVPVTSAPTEPDVGTLYMTPIQPGRDKLKAKSIWLGGEGWVVTAPNGKLATIATPVKRSGMPESGPLNLAPLWTFLYKNGASEAATSYLATQPSEEIEALSATKAERERIVRRRSALPEIQQLFVDITEARYAEIVKWLRDMYLNNMRAALEIQQKSGKISEMSWMLLPGAKQLMTSTYEGNKIVYVPRPDFEARALKMATESADAARENFVDKNTFRISEIARLKGMSPTATLLSIDPGATFNSRMSFMFPDRSSFELRNKTVWKTSPLGVYFAQFPTTFHDVVLPSGKAMKGPSEAKMIDVFAAKADNPAVRRTAARLARGG